MKKEIFWGIIPDDNEQPQIEFGRDIQTKQAYLLINGQQTGGLNLNNGNGLKSIEQLAREDAVSKQGKETVPHFTFDGHPDSGLNGRVMYGASGDYSLSANGRSAALKKHSVAINNQTVANGAESFAAGYATATLGASAFATGSKTLAEGEASHTEGEITHAKGKGSHAEGSLSKAIGLYAHSEGYQTEAVGDYSHAEGSGSKSFGSDSHAEGNNTETHTEASHAEGASTKVISVLVKEKDGENTDNEEGDVTIPDYESFDSFEDFLRRSAACAHAEGSNSYAMGYGAHAEGVGTRACGYHSHTEGFLSYTGILEESEEDDGTIYLVPNLDYGMGAHAEGYKTQAIGNYSHAGGIGTIAKEHQQRAIGSYNADAPDALLIIGNGESEDKRRNAFEFNANGDIHIYYNGDMYSLHKIIEAANLFNSSSKV